MILKCDWYIYLPNDIRRKNECPLFILLKEPCGGEGIWVGKVEVQKNIKKL